MTLARKPLHVSLRAAGEAIPPFFKTWTAERLDCHPFASLWASAYLVARNDRATPPDPVAIAASKLGQYPSAGSVLIWKRDHPLDKGETKDYYRAHIVPEAIFPRLGNDMRSVNGFFLFDLGQIWQLTCLTQGVDVRSHMALIGQCLFILGLFVEHPDNQNDLPESVDEANQLIDVLKSIIERQTEKITTENQIIIHTLARFRALFNSELSRIFTFVVEDKRGFNSAILWRNPLRLLSSDVVPLLSDFVATNLNEAAKCLLLDRFTSVGFHSMRSVECVARKYYELISGNAPPYFKNGKEYFKTLGLIVQELTDKHESLKQQRTASGDLAIIASTLKALCKTYRDPLSHPEINTLTENQAVTTFNQTMEVVSTMVIDAKNGGSHFAKPWDTKGVF